MARGRVLSGFVVTLGVLALLVAFSLRNGSATAGSTGAMTTLVDYLPAASLARAEVAAVHVVNLGSVPAPTEHFTISFIDQTGALILPEQECLVLAGETCIVQLQGTDCTRPAVKGRCPFRAVVVGEPIPCGAAGTGAGEWTATMEIIDASGSLKYVVGGNSVFQLPIDTCPGADQGTDIPADLPVPPHH